MPKKLTAFCIINTELGEEESVITTLKENLGIEEAFIVYGVYDIIAKVSADTMDKLKDIVTWKVRRLNKVQASLTMIVIEREK